MHLCTCEHCSLCVAETNKTATSTHFLSTAHKTDIRVRGENANMNSLHSSSAEGKHEGGKAEMKITINSSELRERSIGL